MSTPSLETLKSVALATAIAAGDLLNWVLSRRSEGRQVIFLQPHRLLALFFGAMGINEHARVRLQTV